MGPNPMPKIERLAIHIDLVRLSRLWWFWGLVIKENLQVEGVDLWGQIYRPSLSGPTSSERRVGVAPERARQLFTAAAQVAQRTRGSATWNY